MTLYLGGGGSAAQESQVWQRASAGVDRLLYWPFALAEEHLPAAETWLRSGLDALEIDVGVETWTSLEGHSAAELATHDLLFVGGGLTSKLATHVRAYGFEPAVRGFLTDGGRYYGGSAGALLACEWLSIAALIEDDPDAQGMEGLGLVPGVSLLPHADKHPPGRAAQIAKALGHDVLVLPEASGVVVDGTSLRAIGPDIVQLVSSEGVRTTLDT